MTQEDIKTNFSQNLIKLRHMHNLTQLQLAEKLNYSDKSISKWEVGSVLPDIETLTNIAEFFGVTVNTLIYPQKKKISLAFLKNHLFTTLIAFFAVWLVATIVYYVMDFAWDLERLWLVFIVAIPISFVVLIVFVSMWFKKIWLILSISGLLWSILLNIYLIVNNYHLWFIFIVGVVGQIVVLLSSQLKKLKKPNMYNRADDISNKWFIILKTNMVVNNYFYNHIFLCFEWRKMELLCSWISYPHFHMVIFINFYA